MGRPVLQVAGVVVGPAAVACAAGQRAEGAARVVAIRARGSVRASASLAGLVSCPVSILSAISLVSGIRSLTGRYFNKGNPTWLGVVVAAMSHMGVVSES